MPTPSFVTPLCVPVRVRPSLPPPPSPPLHPTLALASPRRRRFARRRAPPPFPDAAPPQSTHALRVVDGGPEALHPVLAALASRRGRRGRRDGMKIGLCIEGGGMRGAVSAGMCAAIKYVGVEDVFDVVYGCSAGAIVGAYFVSRQLPVFGAQIYFDALCGPLGDGGDEAEQEVATGRKRGEGLFIDLRALRHHPYVRRLLGGKTGKTGKSGRFYISSSRPVLHLDALLDVVVRVSRPLNWLQFWRNHQRQPLRPVATNLSTMTSATLKFTSLDELLDCLRASARVPGIAGDPVVVAGDPCCDGLLFEPLPFRSAIADGCTHVVVLRTKPDKMLEKVPRKPGVYEKLVAAPYFNMQESPARAAADYVASGEHLKVYRRDAAELVSQNAAPDTRLGASVFSIVPPSDVAEVKQLEGRPAEVYEGVRTGFAVAYEALSPFATPREALAGGAVSAGRRIAKMVFSDEELAEVVSKKKVQKRVMQREEKEMRRKAKISRKAGRAAARDAHVMSLEDRYFV